MNALHLTPTASLVFLFITLAAIAAFAEVLSRRIAALRWGHPENRFNRMLQRAWLTVKYAFGQYRMPQEPTAGLWHIFIFAGFLVVSLRTLTLFGIGITGNPELHLPGLAETALSGQIYSFLKDIVALLVILGCAGFAWRRLVSRPKRMQGIAQGDAVLILAIIVLLMLTDIGIAAARHASSASTGLWPAPTASWLGQFISPAAAPAVYHVNLWAHCLLILGFLNYLPFGKHFHIITSFPNVFFSRLSPHGRLEPIHDLESVMEQAMESGGGLGIKQVEDHSWKMLLDTFSCTECGRCVPQCPASATGKPLSLRDVNVGTRKHLMAKFAALDGELPPPGSPAVWEGEPLTAGAIAEETIWSCTLCRDCEERCPVLIEMVPRIVEMRRHLNMMESSFPPELGKLFTAIERQSNPWGIAQADRGKWLEGTDIRRMADDPDVEYLFFVGCMGSYDARSIKTSQALATILQAAGIRFGVLAEEECCNGETARRLGNEYLAQSLIQANVETFERYKVKKIVTNCPHCFNTLKNEYPDFGGRYQVEHAVELVTRLIGEKRIRLQPGRGLPVAFHDPCFLGRYNSVFEPPRGLIRSAGGLLHEPSLAGRQSFCCGAGGGRMWIEEQEPRVNTARFDEIYSSSRQPSTIAVACPFCRTMLSDASKSRGKDEEVQVKDVVELVAESLGS